MSQPSSKPVGERWIPIANLILTIIMGIGVAFYLKSRDERLALILQQRNEDFQKQVIALQSDIERKSSLANLELAPVCPRLWSCAGGIEIKNGGPAAAKNVRLVAYVSSVNEVWKDELHDISQLVMVTTNPSLDFSSQDVKVNAMDSARLVGNNATEFTIDTLPPNAHTRFMFSLATDTISTTNVSVTRDITVTLPSEPTSGIRWRLPQALLTYLESKVSVASLVVSVSCDNCEGSKDGARSVVSTLSGWAAIARTSIARTSDTSEIAVISDLGHWAADYQSSLLRSDPSIIVEQELRMDYFVPAASQYVPPTSLLYLQVSDEGPARELVISEVSPP